MASATEIVGKVSSVKYDYMETGNSGQNLDSERADFGKINGFDLSVRSDGYNSANTRLFQSANFSYHGGNTEYVGSYQGGTYGDITRTTKNKLYEFSYLLGGAKAITNDVALGANVGAGMRSWQRSLADGNVETYYWSNWIIGARADWQPIQHLTLSATADWQKAVNPKMYSTGVGSKFDLGDTSGYKIGAHANYKLTQSLALECDYIYDYWKINKSNIVDIGGGTVVWEPDSKTKNQYLKIGLAYRF